MPAPVSRTRTRTPSSSRSIAIRTDPPAGVWRSALSIRLSRTRSIRPRSASTSGRRSPATAARSTPHRSAASANLRTTSLASSATCEALAREAHAARVEPRKLGQLVDEAAELLALAQRDRDVAAPLLARQRVVAAREQLEVAAHRDQRHAQVVRDVRDQLGAQPRLVLVVIHRPPRRPSLRRDEDVTFR
jgi:hypothetical protein